MTIEFESLPASTLCYSFSYLVSREVHKMSLVSKRLRSLVISSSDAENEGTTAWLWRILLIRDFRFDVDDDDSQLRRTLDVCSSLSRRRNNDGHNDGGIASSVFGRNARESVRVASSLYDSWRGWSKASAVFYDGTTKSLDNKNVVHEQRIHAPYFLRAADFWCSVYEWCDHNKSGRRLGNDIKASLLPGVDRKTGRFVNVNSKDLSAHSFEAVFAFHDGQDRTVNGVHDAVRGLFGGYEVYDHFSCTGLCGTNIVDDDWPSVTIADSTCRRGSAHKIVYHPSSSELSLEYFSGNLLAHGATRAHPPRDDVGLAWLEEYARRLHRDDEIAVHSLVLDGMPPEMPPVEMIMPFPTARSPAAGRAVTRGVEVVASAYPTHELGVIAYSLRIRVLTPGEEGYATPTERGFTTCQLVTRHWRITDYDKEEREGRVDEVNGHGVVGRFPLFQEGGYRDDRQDRVGAMQRREQRTGVFRYESCARVRKGSFEGKIRLVPGSIERPTGPPFFIEVARFVLDMEPEILF